MAHNRLVRNLASISFRTPSRGVCYFITTPIFYVNSSPHIGHVHTLLVADALNIYHQLKFNDTNTIFSTGVDEHGIKIQTAAENSGMDCREFCNQNAGKFLSLFKNFDTTMTDFIRTTEDRHKSSVRTIWSKLKENGFIYKSTYSGWYCSSDEVFVPESQVHEKQVNGEKCHFDSSDNRLVWSSEENYMFRLSAIEEKVHKWLSEKKPVIPEKFNDQAIELMQNLNLGDVSISRPKSRLNWGISVPGDPSQTIYVWLDALTNYLTIAGYPRDQGSLERWPIDCQVIGKDILKFHAIYWPAFLLALSLPLPRTLLCHSHWLVDSKKMSKSKGNVVDPWEEIRVLSQDGLRYYLLRCSTPHSDTDYSRTQAIRRINSELADTYGNLLSRCCSPVINPTRSFSNILVKSSLTKRLNDLLDEMDKLKEECQVHYKSGNFYRGIDKIMSTLRLNNAIYEEEEPWKMVKLVDTDVIAFNRYNNLQAVTFECLRICSILLQPIIPSISRSALDRLNVEERTFEDARVRIKYADSHKELSNHPLKGNQSILFRKLKDKIEYD